MAILKSLAPHRVPQPLWLSRCAASFSSPANRIVGSPLYVVRCTSRPFHFIFICMPAAVEAGASIGFAVPLALVELCVLAEAITFMGVLAAADAGGIT